MGLFSRSGSDKTPKLAEVAGFVFRYAQSDESGRPSLLVTGNGGSARVWLAPIEVTEARVYCRPEVDRIVKITQEHEAAWLADRESRAA